MTDIKMDNKTYTKVEHSDGRIELIPVVEEVKVDKWSPQGGDWFVNSDGRVLNFSTTIETKVFGMERTTEQLAEKHLKRLKEFNMIAAYVDEFAPDFEPEWGVNCNNYFICYDEDHKVYYFGAHGLLNSHFIYMPKHVAIQLVDDLNSGRVLH